MHSSLLRPVAARALGSILLLVPALLLKAQNDTVPVADSTAQPHVQVFTLSQDELDNEAQSQDVSGLLQSSRDVFTSVAGYNFGAARFRIRGLDAENNPISINGVRMNDLETGWAPFSQWGGLNDVTRRMEVHTGIQASRFGFGGIAGWSNIDARASGVRKGFRASYALTNRSYNNRLMGTYATGLMKNGWAFALSASHRWAGEGYIDGTYFYGTSYFLSAEKKLNERHSIGFTGFGVNLVQGRAGIATAEAYDLTGTHYYNPNWGYQAGEKRNARESRDHKPVLMVTDWYTPDSATTWTTSVFASFGRDGLTGLNWYDAKDPRPDYYRNFPSYYSETDPAYAATLTDAWQNDVNTQQIDWDALYDANRNNLYALHDADGVSGDTLIGRRSKYIVEEVRDDLLRYGLNSAWSRQLDPRNTLTLGLMAQNQRARNFKVMDDLLGGEFWVDVDQFAEQDFVDPDQSQNDLNNPNHVVTEGEEFGFKYDLNIRQAEVFGQLEHRGRQWETYGGLALGTTTFWRKGFYRNGLFPDNSEGDSEKRSFVTYGVKAGATYKINGRNYITANAAYLTRPPVARTVYVSPRTRDEAIPGLTTEKVFSGDVNYMVRAPRVKARATFFHASIADQVWARSYYHDEFRTFVNYTMQGVDQTHTGIELGVEAKASSTVVVNAVFTTGQYRYGSRPEARITRDNSTEILASDRTVYWENFRLGGMPQTAASAGIRYNDPAFWSVGVNGNFFADMYLDPNPDRRTAEAVANLVTDDPQWAQLLDQEKLDDGFTLDIFAMKSWMIQRKYRIALNLSVSNLLDNTDLVTGGFEQLRYESNDPDKFPAKYSYMYGRTYYAMLTFSF